MTEAFEFLGFNDIQFIQQGSLTRIKGVSEITGYVWELPVWEWDINKVKFYRYPELEGLNDEQRKIL